MAADTKSRDLPEKMRVEHIEYRDPESGLMYGGDFTFKRLTLGDIRKVGIRKAELNGGMNEAAIDSSVLMMNAMLAHLEVAILKAPEWWKPSEFYSGDVVVRVYGKLMEFEDSFRSPLRSEGQPGQPGAQEGSQVEAS